MKIVDIKDSFISEEAYRIYADCMFEPTFEKFRDEARELINDGGVSIFGRFEDGMLSGVIALKSRDTDTEIVGIAVDRKLRGCGVGREMISFAYERFGALFAETDDDAVSFYRKCGFKIDRFVKTFPNGECVRYNCTKY